MRHRSSKKTRRSTLCVIGTTLALLLTACGGEEPDVAAPDDSPAEEGPGDDETDDVSAGEECEPVTARASHHISAESAAHIGMEALAEEAAAGTEGRITIEVFSDAQLGGLGEMTENLRSGAIEIALVDSGAMSQFAGELGVFDLPFLFEEMTEFNDLMDGPVGETVEEIIVSEAGVSPLYWSAVGLRDMFFVDTEVRTPADIEGLTMRVPEAPVWVDTFEALNTSPTAIPAGELYTALETGVVDGFEFPLGTAVDLNMYEPVNYLTKTGHILTNILIAASPQFLDSLCDADREALMAAADAAEQVTRDGWVSDNENAVEVLEENLTVIEDADLQAFRDATSVVHEDFVEEHGSELYDVVTSELGR